MLVPDPGQLHDNVVVVVVVSVVVLAVIVDIVYRFSPPLALLTAARFSIS